MSPNGAWLACFPTSAQNVVATLMERASAFRNPWTLHYQSLVLPLPFRPFLSPGIN